MVSKLQGIIASDELRRQVSITTCTSTGAMGGDVHMHGGHVGGQEGS